MLALLIPVAACLLQWMLWAYLQPYVWFLFYPAVFFSSWLGGRVCGWVATGVSAALVWYFFIPPTASFAIEHPGILLSIGGFVIVGALFSTVHDRLRVAQVRAEQGLAVAQAANDQLEAHVRQRTRELEEANGALRESEARLRSVTDTSRVGLVIVDQQHCYRYANRAYTEILHLPAEPIVGQRVADVLASVYADQIRSRLVRAFGGEKVSYELHVPASGSGERGRHFAVSYEPGRDQSGPIVVVVIADITERKTTEEKLVAAVRESGNLRRALDEHAIVAITDARGVITAVNDKFCEISHYSREELVGQDHRIINSGHHPKEFIRDLWTMIKRGHVWHGDIKNRAKDGSFYWVNTTIVPLLDEADPHPREYIAIRADITRRKFAEEALRDSEEKFSRMFGSSPVATSLSTVNDGRYVDVNDAFLKVFQRTREEVVGHTVLELDLWVDLGQRAALFAQLKATGAVHNFEMQLRAKSGQIIDVLWSGVQVVIGGESCLLGSGLDITQRRIAEVELRDSEDRFRSLVTLLPDALFINQDNRIVFVNERGLRLWRAERAGQVLGRSPLDFVHPDWHERVKERIRTVVSEGGIAPVWATLMVALDGTVVPVETTAAPFVFDGKPAVQVVVRDITERVQAEEKMRFQDAVLRETGHIAKVGGWSFDALTGEGYWTEEVARIHDLDPNDPTSRDIGLTYYLGESRTRIEAAVAAAVADGTPYDLELELATARGNRKWVRTIGHPVVDNGRVVRVRGSFQDITERRRTEAEIRQLNAELEQRVVRRTAQLEEANRELEAFSYSVSHDLRAPLRTIDGFSDAVLTDYGALLPADGIRQLGLIREGAQRMGALIDDLLAFSRLSRLALNRREIDVCSLVAETLEEFRAERAGRAVEIEIGDLPSCRGDRSLLKQVWVNLLSNALKYTRGRSAARIAITSRREGDADVYSVCDNGTGFDMRYASKLFRVFQRLHREDEFEGTGVGLAIVERIVHRHGGRVWVEAAVDRGATFFFTLGTDGEEFSS